MSETQTVIATDPAAPPTATPSPAPATILLPAKVAEALSEAARVIENIEAPLDVLNLLIERRKTLRKELASIDTQIHILGGAIPKGQRMVWQCKRCAYRWQSFSVEPPRACARCRSVGWNKEPQRLSARRPSDPPAPSWKPPSEKDHRRMAVRIVPWASPPALTEATAAAAAAKVDPPSPTAPSAPSLAPPPSVGLPPPPRASAFAPVVPPAPPVPARPLSEQLAEVILPPVAPVQQPAELLSVDNPEADAYAPEEDDHADDHDADRDRDTDHRDE
jgi:predicted Zn-ribbon and HTH transcriptional regulator